MSPAASDMADPEGSELPGGLTADETPVTERTVATPLNVVDVHLAEFNGIADFGMEIW